MTTVRSESPNIIRIGLQLLIVRLIASQDTYNRVLYRKMCRIDKQVFPAYAEQLIDCLKLTEKKSSNYRNAETESGVIVAEYPIMRPYYMQVYRMVKKHRGKCGLIQ